MLSGLRLGETVCGYQLLGEWITSFGEIIIVAVDFAKEFQPFVVWRWDSGANAPFSGMYCGSLSEAVESAQDRAK